MSLNCVDELLGIRNKLLTEFNLPRPTFIRLLADSFYEPLKYDN